MKLACLLFVVAGCGGSAPPPTAPAPAVSPAAPATAAATPRPLPEYPGSMVGGVRGGPDPTEITIATDPLDVVRAFYSKDRLAGFEVIGGDASQASPLRLRDAPAHRQYSIAIYESNGATMIETTTHVY